MGATHERHHRSSPRLSHKRLNVTFTKSDKNGKFAESGTNTVKLTGLRASAVVTKVGGVSMNSLNLRIWGMTLSKMNDLSTLGLKDRYRRSGGAQQLR